MARAWRRRAMKARLCRTFPTVGAVFTERRFLVGKPVVHVGRYMRYLMPTLTTLPLPEPQYNGHVN